MLLMPTTPSSGAERQQLRGHVPEVVARLKLPALGRLPATNRLNLAIGLPLRNTNELAVLLRDIYDPASPQFRHYLTPEQFTERFGPSERHYQAVAEFATRHGLAVTARHPNRVVLDVAGQVSDIEAAFQITLRTYQHPKEARQFYAPDTEPSVDPGLAVLHVSGLENATLPRPLGRFTPLGGPASAGRASPANGSGPWGQYIGKDLRAAYVPGVSLLGDGQKVGLFEMDGYYPRDIEAYKNLAGLPAAKLTNVLLDGFNGVPGGFNGEVALDIEMVIAMAPNAEVIVYEGLTPDDLLNRMATDNGVNQISSSWYWSPLGPTAEQIFQQMAAQGQSFFEACGDSDAYSAGIPGVEEEPLVTQVGGTTLTMSGNGAAYSSETVWNPGNTQGSSGGVSLTYPIPSWQQGINMTLNGGSTTMRNVPDVAMVGDALFTIASNGDAIGYTSGTSCAAPLWAGFCALVNQAALANGQPVMGFLNPALYAIGKSSAYAANFHDVITGNNENYLSPNKFRAVAGYDLCTGWGSPRGSNLLYSLAIPEPLVVAPATELLFSGPFGGPFGPPAGNLALATKTTNTLNWAVASDVSWLSLSPNTGVLSGSASTNVTVQPSALASTLAAGSYQATLFFTNLDDQVVQTRSIVLAVVAPPAITAQPTNQTALAGAAASFTVGTAPNALLYYQWSLNQGGSATNLADGGGIGGAATSTLTISNVSASDVGSYSVVVSNAAGVVPSAPATLSLLSSKPVILAQPAAQNLLPGASAAFSVVAVGDQPLSYSWQKDGVGLSDGSRVAGSSSNTLTIANAGLADAGTYTVAVSNALGWAVSTGAVLSATVVTAPGVALDTLYSFDSSGTVGFNPYAGLVQGSDGNFYGTASQGGATRQGTIYRMQAGGVVSLVHSFINGNEGAFPYSGLVQGSNGLLYGLTTVGGTNNGLGTAFRISTNGAIASASLYYPVTGSYPHGGLVQAADGNFYGLTTIGGASGYFQLYLGSSGNGALVKLSQNLTLTAMSPFNYEDGALPSSTLVQGLDGKLYGTAQLGGTNGGWGTIFRVSPQAQNGPITGLFSFNNNNGATPVAGLAQDADGTLYGTTYSGGAHNAGTLFKLSSDGTFTSLYSFSGGAGGSNCYGGLVLASDGNLYGTTENGGVYGAGTVFQLTPDGAVTTLAQLDGYQGANPEGTLVQGNDGSLYGTTYNGGAQGNGAIFRLSFSGQLEITSQPRPVVTFAGGSATFSVATSGGLPTGYQWEKNGVNLTDGGNVMGSNARVLTLTNVSAGDAALYSVVVSNALGVVPSTGARLEVVVSPPYVSSGPMDQTALVGASVQFSVEAGGGSPLSYQWQQNGTNLADGGGITGSATPTLTLAAVSGASAGSYSVIVSNALDVVSSPSATLTVVPANAPGTTLTSFRPFSFNDFSGAYNPFAGVIQARDGYLYGTTVNGGTNGYGTVFRIATSGAGFSVMRSFSYHDVLGSTPYGGLIQGADGKLYGSAFYNGSYSGGSLFRISTASVAELLYSFLGGYDGADPAASLVQGKDGNFYGTTPFFGYTNRYMVLLGFGTVFRLNTNGTLDTLHNFSGGPDGGNSVAPLIQATDGRFYGTTLTGGSYGSGIVFSVSGGGAFTPLVSFDYTNGAYSSNAWVQLPDGGTFLNAVSGGLVQASDGALYGTAASGGTNGGWGTVFRVTTNGALTSLHSFNYQDGAAPAGGLVEGADGNLYGTTSQGGIGGQGTVFQITKSGQLTTLAWFYGLNGAGPQATLLQARDGSFYGTTAFGGIDFNGAAGTGDGVLFRLTVPMFVANPLTQAVATAGVPYAASLSTNAVMPAGDTLTFAKVAGPAWLQVASNGALSGTPAVSDIGPNSFSVSLADTNGWSSSATLTITVVPAPLLASLSLSQGTLVLNWSGGQPPYSVQMATGLASPAWQTIAGPMTNTTLVVTPTNAVAFYRIQGQ
jgi:uncharacterized repeat protein (TIGR03803 family)